MSRRKVKPGIMMMTMVATALCLTGCFSENAVEDETDGALKILNRAEEKEQEAQVIPKEDMHNSYIEPLGLDYDVAAPEDSIVNASFTVKDFNMENNTLTFLVYKEELYDSVEISLMQIGDTIKVGGREIVVESIQDRNGDLIVNGGYEEGGTELIGWSGGTYKARPTEEGPAYLEVGRSTLPLSEELTISDGYKDAASPKTATYEELQDYLDGLDGASDSFNYLSTRIRIENRKVVDITRTQS